MMTIGELQGPNKVDDQQRIEHKRARGREDEDEEGFDRLRDGLGGQQQQSSPRPLAVLLWLDAARSLLCFRASGRANELLSPRMRSTSHFSLFRVGT